jgi:hypothetical protein
MSLRSAAYWRTKMAKRKLLKMTPEEIAQRELHQQWVRERIEYHEAKAREQEEARAPRRK